MYDLLDRPVEQLSTIERSRLDRMRRWVHALTVGVSSLPGEADPFDAAMRALDRGSTDTLVLQRPCHSTVEETEAVLLALWRHVAAGRNAAARMVAAALVAPTQVGPMLSAMARAA